VFFRAFVDSGRSERWTWVRVVSQELNDSRNVPDGRNGCLVFPFRNRDFVNADAVGYLLLQELEVQTVCANVVT
jgi:hypothetical protein